MVNLEVATTNSAPGKIERTRQKLVNAVRDEVNSSGDFNAELIAHRASISPATFYNHFATKDQALLAAYENVMDSLVDLVASRCRIEKLLDEGMHNFMENWVLSTAAFFSENVALFRLAQAAFGRSKDMRTLFREHEAAVMEHYRRFIELGQAAKAIRDGDQQSMAQMLTIFAESWHHSLVQNLKPGDALHEELTQSLVRMLTPQP